MTESARTICLHTRIRGRVQGVWYRAWMEKAARSLDVSGWVRNRRDGSVEALLCGREDAVRRLIELAHDGPPAARVESIDVEEVADPPGMSGFEIRPTV